MWRDPIGHELSNAATENHVCIVRLMNPLVHDRHSISMQVQALCSLQAAAAPARPCLPAPVAVLRLQHPMTRQGTSPKLERGGKAGGTELKGRKRRNSMATAAATDVPTAAPGSAKVGFLGIGIMGYAMVGQGLKDAGLLVVRMQQVACQHPCFWTLFDPTCRPATCSRLATR